MIKDRDFIVFSDDWGRHPFSGQHIMKHFLKDNRILWVNTIGMRNPRLSIYDVKRVIGKFRSWSRPDASAGDLPANLTVVAPVMLPYNSVPAIRNWNRNSVVKKTREWSERLGFSDPIFLATVPNAADYAGSLNESVIVYYCVDEFSEWPGVLKKMTRKFEKALLKKADLIACTSDELTRSKVSSQAPTYLLSHGVDVEHFSKAGRVDTEVPDLKDVPKPIIGYFGLFDERSDQDLLTHLLESRPEWSLVVVGNSVVDMGKLKKFENFYHIGPVPYDVLPQYAAYFDVCIIPYVLNELTANINPLKLKEYLATGKPVVSTALPEAIKFNQWMQIASGHVEFRDAVSLALEVKSVGGAPAAEALVGETWIDKAACLSGWIEDALERKLKND